jgi:hypothetical protein
MTTTTTLPAHLDGPGLVAWIEEEEGGEITNAAARLGSYERKLRQWRAGVTATVEAADIALNKLGLHLGHVPESLYVEAPDRSISKALRAEMVRQVVVEGRSINAVALEYGRDFKTVRRAVDNHRAAAQGLQVAA